MKAYKNNKYQFTQKEKNKQTLIWTHQNQVDTDVKLLVGRYI